MRICRCTIVGLTAGALVWGLADGSALAAKGKERRRAGVLLHVQGAEHVIDLGRADGLQTGARVRLFRTVSVRHPSTGRRLRDRFEVGEVRVAETAARMAVLIVPPAMARRLRPGDPVLVLQSAPPPKSEAARATVAVKTGRASVVRRPGGGSLAKAPAAALRLKPRAQQPAQAADEAEAERLFRASLGRQPAERMALWRRFLTEHPDSRLGPAVRRELNAMAELAVDQRRLRENKNRSRRDEQLRRTVAHEPLPPLRVGEPAWVVLTAADWSAVADVRVYFRRLDAGVFEMLRAEPSRRLHRRVRLPDAVVQTPGFAYFAVVTTPDGAIRHLGGDASRPHVVAVSDARSSIARPKRDATTLRWITEFVDFNRGRGDDRVLISELSVAYRLDHGRLHAFDMGYGFLNGRGGRVADGGEALAGGGEAVRGDTLDGRRASFKYAWLGTDWRLHPNWHGIVRFVMGLDDGGLDTGLELLTRIGPEQGTNLQLGISALADTGRAASVALNTHVVPKVAMTGVFEVTNRPVGEDLGIRLIYQADFELTEFLALTGRASYALRTIDHAGLGLGAGVALNW